jgi:hypothetical protein
VIARATQRLFLIVLATVLAAMSGAPAQHLELDRPASMGPVAKTALDERLEKGAGELLQQYPQGASRIVAFDMAFPKSDAEYAAVGGHALLVLTAVSREPDELPLKTVYARTTNGDVPLQRVASWQDRVPDTTTVFAAYGSYRQYSVYLWPLAILPNDAILMCDFAANRNGFTVSHHPTGDSVPVFSATPGTRSRDALRAFIAREYPGLVSETAFDAVPTSGSP